MKNLQVQERKRPRPAHQLLGKSHTTVSRSAWSNMGAKYARPAVVILFKLKTSAMSQSQTISPVPAAGDGGCSPLSIQHEQIQVESVEH
ncbi:hypothetical protein VFPPC_16350 [Pochonia chlamydosporia 170]|uniref:Uncharacterized protein n=1 Tax=Pochonia chlamydosporia 170 TaxID=1380566 RepID=A0A179FKA8_METCM|nr:hypothetical protein VFPPC_16350 [Pochonia chlamydosporia 170]OAQ65473.1 hypothetical protein VFPPC_16350 [Pochonia chlamydosporia 170]